MQGRMAVVGHTLLVVQQSRAQGRAAKRPEESMAAAAAAVAVAAVVEEVHHTDHRERCTVRRSTTVRKTGKVGRDTAQKGTERQDTERQGTEREGTVTLDTAQRGSRPCLPPFPDSFRDVSLLPSIVRV